jgi:N-acetylglucosamine-6-phosphate deacetylase
MFYRLSADNTNAALLQATDRLTLEFNGLSTTQTRAPGSVGAHNAADHIRW